MIDGLLPEDLDSSKEINRTIVRITTYYYSDKRGITIKKDIRVLKKRSSGSYCLLLDEVSNIGVAEYCEHIVNIGVVEDGIYEIITVNENKDYETGNVEDYDYELIPYDPS